jgi:hypothetical protein
MAKRAKEWRIYKPQKNNDGAASKLELKITDKDYVDKEGNNRKLRDVQMFWVLTQQIGVDENNNATFAWTDANKTVTLKLNETDLGEILAVLNGLKTVTGATGSKYEGLFHKNEKGSATLCLKAVENRGYTVRATKKVGNNHPVAIYHTLSYGEVSILKVVVEAAVRQIYQW